MKNKVFDIEFNEKTGNIKSIVLAGDAHRMNWCSSRHEWGGILLKRTVQGKHGRHNCVPVSLESFRQRENSAVSVFSNGKIKVTVERNFLQNGNFSEKYIFKNISGSDVFLQEAEYGIYTPFCDEYISAAQSLVLRCSAHIWCGENVGGINALRQGESNLNLGLCLTGGSLFGYSIDRQNQSLTSNTRGLIILNSSGCSLLPGEESVISWEIFVHGGKKDFNEKSAAYFAVSDIAADKYTYFEGEKIHFSFVCASASPKVSLNGGCVPFEREGERVCVEYEPPYAGEYRFELEADGAKTHVLMNVVKPLEQILESRISFIVKNQQCLRRESALYGAYLIYDNETESMYFDDDRADHNACRERIGMAILIAKYLQTHKNDFFYESLMKYVSFAKREFVDVSTGEVFNTIGKNRSQLRLYNAPWVVTLMTELYNLTKDAEYMDIACKIIRNYYSVGGENFYPNGLSMKLTANAMRDCGKGEYAEKTLELFAAHARNMIENRTDYPAMECIYEQTIVTPVVAYLCDMYALTNDAVYKNEAAKHLENLDRFNGSQPDYRLNGMPVRYWDDYWFGKSQLYGDTFPHYWSCLTARAWNSWYEISGDGKYRDMAVNCMRNCLCLFNEDGSASCAYVYPKRIDGRRGEFFDAWSNDQDFALYFAMLIL